jgi:Fe-S-cluster containining protein
MALDEPLICGSCTACCRSASTRPDDLNAFDYVLTPATTELLDKLKISNPGALIPIESLESPPQDFLDHARQKGVSVAVAELNRRDNGECVYLGEEGCTIYQRRPAVCRSFDCRSLFLKQTRNERRDWYQNRHDVPGCLLCRAQASKGPFNLKK